MWAASWKPGGRLRGFHFGVEFTLALAGEFNPVEFDAKEIARVAKEAGMKYIIITSKHHDGFSLWDSDVSQYDIIDATPFGRDILRELGQA